MKAGSTDPYKERIRIEAEESILNTAKRRAKKAQKNKNLKEAIESYSSPRNTGNIDWIPEHSYGHEKWNGIRRGKKVFKIEKMVYRYSLKILNEELVPVNKQNNKPINKSITERTFEAVAKKAEKILENYLKKLKKDEVSKNNSAGR